MADPCDLPTGASVQSETDFQTKGGDLEVIRIYNSRMTSATSGPYASSMGLGWHLTYDSSATNFVGMASGSSVQSVGTVSFIRPSGQVIIFNYSTSSSSWLPDPDVTARLVQNTDASGTFFGWSLYPRNSAYREDYDNQGRLSKIDYGNGSVISFLYNNATNMLATATDSRGRALHFTYEPGSGGYYLKTIMLPDGNTLNYAYNGAWQLSGVTYPAGSDGVAHMRQYGYTSGLLSSLTDENQTLTSSWTYTSDGSIASNVRGPISAPLSTYRFQYNPDGSITTTSRLGQVTNFSTTVVQDVNHLTGASAYCSDCGSIVASSTYYPSGLVESETDFLGHASSYTYDSTGMELTRVEAQGTANQRTTQTAWNASFKLPVRVTVQAADGSNVARTSWIYNGAGQILARCAIEPTNSAASGYACSASGAVPAGVRRWVYTYCTAVDGTQCPIVGLLLTATGPRTDVAQTTRYSYYLDSATSGCTTPGGACHQPGDLHTVTDPSGHVTTVVSNDADGRITRETDANGINTDLTYTPRGWLTSRTMGGAQTTFGYTPYGAVSSVTDPDGVTTSYGYDAAHRLVKVTDAQGNYVQYTLDAAGNKTAEQVFDASGTVHQSLSRTFNPLGQLTTVVDGLNHTVFNASAAGSYDANGNLVQSADGLGIQRQSSYDALNRLVQAIDNYNGTN